MKQKSTFKKYKSKSSVNIAFILAILQIFVLNIGFSVYESLELVSQTSKIVFLVIASVINFIYCVLFLIISCRDPAFQKKSPPDTKIQSYCSICKLSVPRSTQHCLLCDVCVEHYDHHCIYLNRCIGGVNYRYFVSFLVLTVCSTVLELVLSIYSIITVRSTPIIIVSVVNIITQLFPFIFGSYLLCYHIFLISVKSSTYEHIIQQDQLYYQGKITNRVRYAAKKCACLPTSSAVLCTRVCFKEDLQIINNPKIVPVPTQNNPQQTEPNSDSKIQLKQFEGQNDKNEGENAKNEGNEIQTFRTEKSELIVSIAQNTKTGDTAEMNENAILSENRVTRMRRKPQIQGEIGMI
ncbi:Palmitoyltransferase [Hexamita inflata]|uniref:Palmitoyltransferase n=1 Tax=Hexamita inflata TaxID=28002 RepID=A0AA86NZ75_9EUKA|nr:Palmitoyltransferase [Hexamita inflata]